MTIFTSIIEIPIPAIYIINNFFGLIIAMLNNQVLIDPSDDMIFECSLDDLVEEVRRQKFMNIGTRKELCEWLLHI